MRVKHFVNDPVQLVEASLRSLALTNPANAVDSENKIVYSRQPDTSGKVSIISGGGSGHEPSFGGFVGTGLLTASVAGSIFASPSSKQVLAGIEKVDSTTGVLVTVMNYTGDVLNFGLAVEKARARNPKMEIEMLIVGDDAGVPKSRAGKVGRRGIAGTVLVHKITGALAAEGLGLDEILKAGQLVGENLVSIGASLDHVHVPGAAVNDDGDATLGQDEIELGMGIHNEPGSGRVRGADAKLPTLIADMLRKLLDPADPERAFLKTSSYKMVLLINNLGSISCLELGAIVTEVTSQLKTKYKVTLARTYAGTFMTSLDGPGFSISLLNVIDVRAGRNVVELLDAPAEATGWTAPISNNTWEKKFGTSVPSAKASSQSAEVSESSKLKCDLDITVRRLRAGLEAVVVAEAEVTRYDTVVGDGDCGTTLKRGAEGILKLLSAAKPTDIVTLLSAIATSVEDSMDGTSGALYAIYLNALTKYFRAHADKATVVDTKFWEEAIKDASMALGKYTTAKPSDRTMIDALAPFVKTLGETGDLARASAAATQGAEKTKEMKASLGRSVYVGGEEEWMGKIPDPGAWGLSRFFEGLASIR